MEKVYKISIRIWNSNKYFYEFDIDAKGVCCDWKPKDEYPLRNLNNALQLIWINYFLAFGMVFIFSLLTKFREITFEQRIEIRESFFGFWWASYLYDSKIQQWFVMIKICGMWVENIAEKCTTASPCGQNYTSYWSSSFFYN